MTVHTRRSKICREFTRVSEAEYTHKSGLVRIQKADIYYAVGDCFSISNEDKGYIQAIAHKKRKQGNKCEVVEDKIWVVVDKYGKRVPGLSKRENVGDLMTFAYGWLANKFLCQNTSTLPYVDSCRKTA